jgi:hypothetical protein
VTLLCVTLLCLNEAQTQPPGNATYANVFKDASDTLQFQKHCASRPYEQHSASAQEAALDAGYDCHCRSPSCSDGFQTRFILILEASSRQLADRDNSASRLQQLEKAKPAAWLVYMAQELW